MALPLAILGTLALFSGGLGYPGLPGSHWFEHRVNDGTLVKNMMTESGLATASSKAIFEKQYVHDVNAHDGAEALTGVAKEYGEAWHHAHGTVFWFSVTVSPAMIALAWFFFGKNRHKNYVGAALVPIRSFLENLWFVDALIIKGFVPLVAKFFYFCFTIDKRIVDGLVNGAAWTTERFSFLSGRVDYHGVDGAVRGTGTAMLEGGDAARRLVSGKINDYVFYTVLGLGALLAAVAIFGN